MIDIDKLERHQKVTARLKNGLSVPCFFARREGEGLVVYTKERDRDLQGTGWIHWTQEYYIEREWLQALGWRYFPNEPLPEGLSREERIDFLFDDGKIK